MLLMPPRPLGPYVRALMFVFLASGAHFASHAAGPNWWGIEPLGAAQNLRWWELGYEYPGSLVPRVALLRGMYCSGSHTPWWP